MDNASCDNRLIYVCGAVPLHLASNSLGSGSHSPLSMHVAEPGPVRTKSSEQSKTTTFPGVAGSLIEKFATVRLLELPDNG